MDAYVNNTFQDREIVPAFSGNFALIILREKDGRLFLEPKSVAALRPTIDSYVTQPKTDFKLLRGYAGISTDCISMVEATLRQIYGDFDGIGNGYGMLSFKDCISEDGVLNGLDKLILAPTEAEQIHSVALASEPSLRKDWEREEDEAAFRML